MSRAGQRLALLCHPATPCGALTAVSAQIQRLAPLRLGLEFLLAGDIAQLRLPAHAAGERRDELWKHSCCELFVGSAGSAAYSEFNLAPSTAWAAYEFSAYRQGMQPAALVEAPRIAVTAAAAEVRLRCELDLAGLHAPAADVPWRIALGAVVEERGGRLSYWALRHPLARPDFHHADAFVSGVLP